MTQHTVLILGIGNNLLTDEGIGIHAITALIPDLGQAEHIRLLDGGTLSFTLAAEIESVNHLIVIDAAQLNSPPGTVKIFNNDAMDHFLGHSKRSVHEVGLLDLMDIARLTDHLPEQRTLIAVQPEILTWGEQLTPAAASALPTIISAVKKQLQQWSIPL
ncbi:MAG: HyaD/HybD family hydrogenase maturation endopeptidase [Methylococcales bacterium]|jgi:hydrogenase maturation protease|nr:HyaD/HybD family hydrogenase maturation endopeptidase [Methylococcales bacterium]MBT7445109.1 HyaD/HybD family hydrogenase maturation endopeptidase [Methylococcales bacterium]